MLQAGSFFSNLSWNSATQQHFFPHHFIPQVHPWIWHFENSSALHLKQGCSENGVLLEHFTSTFPLVTSCYAIVMYMNLNIRQTHDLTDHQFPELLLHEFFLWAICQNHFFKILTPEVIPSHPNQTAGEMMLNIGKLLEHCSCSSNRLRDRSVWATGNYSAILPKSLAWTCALWHK